MYNKFECIYFSKWELKGYLRNDWEWTYDPKTNEVIFYHEGSKYIFTKTIVPGKWYIFDTEEGKISDIRAPKSLKLKAFWEYGFQKDNCLFSKEASNLAIELNNRISKQQDSEIQKLDNGWTRLTSTGVDQVYKVKYCNGKVKIFAMFDTYYDNEPYVSWFDPKATVKEIKQFFEGLDKATNLKKMWWLYR